MTCCGDASFGALRAAVAALPMASAAVCSRARTSLIVSRTWDMPAAMAVNPAPMALLEICSASLPRLVVIVWALPRPVVIA